MVVDGLLKRINLVEGGCAKKRGDRPPIQVVYESVTPSACVPSDNAVHYSY